MSLLAIGLTLVLAQLFGRHWRRWRQKQLRAWFAAVSLRTRGTVLTHGAGALVIVGVPVALVAAAQLLLAGSGSALGSLLLSLAVLAFVWGPRDLDRDVARYLEASGEEQRRRYAEPLLYVPTDGEVAGQQACVIRGVFHESLVRWFGVIFWFLVLGPAGALLFRLSHAALIDPGNRALLSEPQRGTMERLAALLDVPPALFSALSLAVVGDFDSVTAAWRRESRRGSQGGGGLRHWGYRFFPQIGFATVMTGEAVEEAFDHDYDGQLAKVNHAMSLVWRALVCWMTVLAILILLGVVD